MSKPIVPQTAVDDGDVVVFMLGMTINRPWKLRSWWPVFAAMPGMLREQHVDRDLGMLASRTVLELRGPTVIQYWRSAEHLERYARSRDNTHMPAWAKFMKSKAATNGDVGIWHETYVTEPGKRETIYLATPRLGFGAAAEHFHPIGAGEETARKRRERGAPRPEAPALVPDPAAPPAADAA